MQIELIPPDMLYLLMQLLIIFGVLWVVTSALNSLVNLYWNITKGPIRDDE